MYLIDLKWVSSPKHFSWTSLDLEEIEQILVGNDYSTPTQKLKDFTFVTPTHHSPIL